MGLRLSAESVASKGRRRSKAKFTQRGSQDLNSGIQPHATVLTEKWSLREVKCACGHKVAASPGLPTHGLEISAIQSSLISDYYSHHQLKIKPYLETRGARQLRLFKAS